MSISGDQQASSDALDILRVIADPVAFQAKLAEFSQAKKDAEDAMAKAKALVGPVDDILALRAQAEADARDAALALEDATKRSQGIVDNANKEASSLTDDAKAARQQALSILDKAKDDSGVMRQQAEQKLNEAEAKLSDAAGSATAIKARAQEELDNALAIRQRASDAYDAAEKVRKDFEDRRKRLIEALDI